MQAGTEFQDAESTISPSHVSSSVSAVPNEKEKISETAFDDALVDDSDHSSTECILDDPEVNDRQHASTDQSTTSTSAYDISRAVQLKKSRCLSDAEKFNFFYNHFIPAFNYKFPAKQYGSRQRSFQHAWLKKFNGLVYSADDKGAYCKFCVLFGKFSDNCINAWSFNRTTSCKLEKGY